MVGRRTGPIRTVRHRSEAVCLGVPPCGNAREGERPACESVTDRGRQQHVRVTSILTSGGSPSSVKATSNAASHPPLAETLSTYLEGPLLPARRHPSRQDLTVDPQPARHQLLPRRRHHHRTNLHKLRHTYATTIIRHSNLHTVQQLLGHSSIVTTLRYLHLDLDDLTGTVDRAFNGGLCKTEAPVPPKRAGAPGTDPSSFWIRWVLLGAI
jgi:hypothetical protein